MLEIVREGTSISARNTEEKLKANDRLVLSCKPQGIIETSEFKGVNLLNQTDLGIEQVSSKTGVMVECVVGPSSSLISKSILDASFRARFNLTILSGSSSGKKSWF